MTKNIKQPTIEKTHYEAAMVPLTDKLFEKNS